MEINAITNAIAKNFYKKITKKSLKIDKKLKFLKEFFTNFYWKFWNIYTENFVEKIKLDFWEILEFTLIFSHMSYIMVSSFSKEIFVEGGVERV